MDWQKRLEEFCEKHGRKVVYKAFEIDGLMARVVLPTEENVMEKNEKYEKYVVLQHYAFDQGQSTLDLAWLPLSDHKSIEETYVKEILQEDKAYIAAGGFFHCDKHSINFYTLFSPKHNFPSEISEFYVEDVAACLIKQSGLKEVNRSISNGLVYLNACRSISQRSKTKEELYERLVDFYVKDRIRIERPIIAEHLEAIKKMKEMWS
jgi:hypothetical protein